MRRPFDSLEDFTGKSGSRKPPDPPAARYVEPLGTRQHLEPLAVWEGPSKRHLFSGSFILRRAFPKLAPFHRSIAAGAFAVVALMVAATLYFGDPNLAIKFSKTSDEVATVPLSEPDEVTQSDRDTSLADASASDDTTVPSDQDQPVRRSTRPRQIRPRVLFAAYNAKHRLPQPKFIISDFIPTTLVVYVENGVVKTRVEPQVSAGYTRSRPSSN